jgi:hypothetical protein
VVDKKARKIICASFSNGRRHGFRLFKESKVRASPETEAKADTGYAGIHKYHKKSVLPKRTKIHNQQTQIACSQARQAKKIAVAVSAIR